MARSPSSGYVPATAGPVLEPAYAPPWLEALARLRAWEWRTERAGRVAVVVLLAAAAVLVAVAAGQRSSLVPPAKGGFPTWMVGPFRGLASWLPDSGMFNSVLFRSLMAAMFVCYLVALACVRRLPVRFVVGALVAAHVLFVLGPPLQLIDVFNYVNYARLGAVHGINPYVHSPASWPVDPSYGFATWHHLLSPYGPLFTLVSYALVPLGLPVFYWTLKLSTAAASLGVLALTRRLAGRLGRPQLAAVAFVGLNPLVLVYGLGGVHNDFFMLLLVLAAVTAVLSSHPARAGAAVVGAMAVKVSAGLALPFALAGVRPGRRRAFLAGTAGAAAAAAALSAAAFGFHGPGLDAQTTLVTPLSPQPAGAGAGPGRRHHRGAGRGQAGAGRRGLRASARRLAGRRLDHVRRLGDAGARGEPDLGDAVVRPVGAPVRRPGLQPLAAPRRPGGEHVPAGDLAPITGYVLDRTHLDPANTATGKHNDAAIHRYLPELAAGRVVAGRRAPLVTAAGLAAFVAASAALVVAKGIILSRDWLFVWLLLGLLAGSLADVKRWARGVIVDWRWAACWPASPAWPRCGSAGRSRAGSRFRGCRARSAGRCAPGG
jgi:alpha-1,6-mannosyltransferase